MTDSADPVAFGTPFNYVLTAQNLGPQPAVGVQITDTLPAGLTATVATASQGTCTIGTSSVTCNIGTLGVNATATVTITVTSSVSGTLTNSASIISEVQDPVSGNNSASEQTTIQLASCSGVTFTGPTPFAGSPAHELDEEPVDEHHPRRQGHRASRRSPESRRQNTRTLGKSRRYAAHDAADGARGARPSGMGEAGLVTTWARAAASPQTR